MTFQTDAIYEGDVLRPLVPLNLGENQLVSVSISTERKPTTADDAASRQREILSAYVRKVESKPGYEPTDGLTNRDHDGLIYGE